MTNSRPQACSSLYGAAMDLGRVRETISRFAEVLDDAERPRTLEGLIRKAGLD